MSLLDFLFPKKCLNCQKNGSYFCLSCRQQIQTPPYQICPVCLRPSIHGLTHPRCQNRYTPDGLTAVFSYQGIIKKAIKNLKYSPWLFDLTTEFVNLVFNHLSLPITHPHLQTQSSPTISRCPSPTHPHHSSHTQNPQPTTHNPILVPVPLHWFRQNQRGFNQSVILGQKLAAKLKIQFLPDLLLRTKPTPSQTQLDKEKRLENIKGAFQINPKFSRSILVSQYPNILLFDDVFTTGATLLECTRVLKKSAFPKVWCLTIAR